MTPRERAIQLMEYPHPDLLVYEIEKAICAATSEAINEDRKIRPHEFIGRADRGCELCGESDRDTIHCYSREHSRRFVARAIEEEREACAQVLDWLIDELQGAQMFPGCGGRYRAGADPARVFNDAICEAIELGEKARAQIRARSEGEKKGE